VFECLETDAAYVAAERDWGLEKKSLKMQVTHIKIQFANKMNFKM